MLVPRQVLLLSVLLGGAMSMCGHVTVLDYGTVVASGPPAIIRTDQRVLDAYLGITEEDDDAGPG